MPNPQVVTNPTKNSPDSGNKQVDGTVVHTDVRSAGKAEIESQMAGLDRMDNATSPGLASRQTRTTLLDTTKYDKAHPKYHHRWVNVKNTERLAGRIQDGYVEVPRPTAGEDSNPDKYGRRLGDDLVLMRQPRVNYEARVADQERLTRARERAHVTEVEAIAQQVDQQLRRMGYRVDKSVAFNEAQ